jgi:hypothetical protein
MFIPVKHQATSRTPLQLYQVTIIGSRSCLHLPHYYVTFISIIRGCVKETVETIECIPENYKENKMIW